MSPASIALSDIPSLSKRIKACCRRAQLCNAHEILLTAPNELTQILRITRQDVDHLLVQVAKAAAPPVISTLDILHGIVTQNPSLEVDGEADSSSSSESDCGPSQSFVPPTPGYEGNFPGLQRANASHSDSDDDDESMDSESPVTLQAVQPSPLLPGETLSRADTTRSSPRDALTEGRDQHLRTSGSVELDRLLNGGFRSGSLSELVGESASGKTQLAIQVSVFAALGFVSLPDKVAAVESQVDFASIQRDCLHSILDGEGVQWGSEVGTSYITSNGERGAHAIVRRALQFAQSAVRERFQHRFAAQLSDPEATHYDEIKSLEQTAVQLAEHTLLHNLHIACVADVETLEHALHYSLPGMMAQLQDTQLPIGVIVVDSLPTFFQQDPSTSDLDSLFQRSQSLNEISDALKRLSLPDSHRPTLLSSPNGVGHAHSAGRVVLVVNHVSDAFGGDKDIARHFVFDTARPSVLAPPRGALPNYPASMGYTAQSAFFSGLLASVPPTLAETIAASATGSDEISELYTLHPKSAQLGHTWSNNINMRLFLAQTRGRVIATDAGNDAHAHARARLPVTVRRAAVVFSAFGPTMLDRYFHDDGTRKWRKEERQLRYVITPSKAVHALAAYTVRNTHVLASTSANNVQGADHDYFTHLDDRDLMDVNLDSATDTL